MSITHRTPGLAAALLPPVGIAPRPHVAAELCPYGRPGDVLWVREAWRPWSWHEGEPICIEFAAGGKRRDCQNPEPEDEVDFEAWEERLQESIQDECETSPRTRIDESGCYSWEGESPLRWRPSIHMPRWASRISLEVTEVRVERLQEITEEEAQAEGRTLQDFGAGGPGHFPHTWDELNASRGYGWDVNPWVWVVEFRVAP